MTIPRLLWVTDRTRVSMPLADVAERAVLGGIDAIQIREKDLAHDELRNLCREIRDRVGNRALVLVNGAPEIAAELGIGCHLPQHADLDGVRQRLGAAALISRSVHSPAAANASAAADWLIVGHVYSTASHPGEDPIGLDGLAAIVASSPRPVMAIGGITAENAGKAIHAGAAGVAVLSAIGSAADPNLAAATLRQEVDLALAQEVRA